MKVIYRDHPWHAADRRPDVPVEGCGEWKGAPGGGGRHCCASRDYHAEAIEPPEDERAALLRRIGDRLFG